MILQKSFWFADLLLKKDLLLVYIKILVKINYITKYIKIKCSSSILQKHITVFLF